MAFEFKGFDKPRYDNTQYGKVRFIRKKGRIIPIFNKKKIGKSLESQGQDLAAFGTATAGTALSYRATKKHLKTGAKMAASGFTKRTSKILSKVTFSDEAKMNKRVNSLLSKAGKRIAQKAGQFDEWASTSKKKAKFLYRGGSVGKDMKTGKFINPSFSIRKGKNVYTKIAGMKDISSLAKGYTTPSVKMAFIKKVVNVRTAYKTGKYLLKPKGATRVGIAAMIAGAAIYGVGTELQLQTKSGKTVK